MSIPRSRDALVESAVSRFATLVRELVETDASASDPDARDRDATDVANHLHGWHVLLFTWLDAANAGETPSFPAAGYTWRDLEQLNLDLRDRYRGDGSIDTAITRLHESHEAALARVREMSDADLFTTSRSWLGGSTLAEPVHECLGGHYAWALEALGKLKTGVRG